MNRHVISVSATNAPTKDDPSAFGYRVSCSCGMRWRNVWRDRQQAEAFGQQHLGYVTTLYASQRVPEAQSGPKQPTATQHTGDGDGGFL